MPQHGGSRRFIWDFQPSLAQAGIYFQNRPPPECANMVSNRHLTLQVVLRVLGICVWAFALYIEYKDRYTEYSHTQISAIYIYRYFYLHTIYSIQYIYIYIVCMSSEPTSAYPNNLFRASGCFPPGRSWCWKS